MKKLSVVIFLLSALSVCAQKDVKPTDDLIISGQIEAETKITLSDFDKFKKHKIGDLVITNHLGEKRGTSKGMTGILFKDILSQLNLKADNPKSFSEFIFTFVASDGYKVAFSWNEIFNSPTGDNFYLITEKEGKKMKDMDERILAATTTDIRTGRRYIKGLHKIIVGRVD